jgi:hypothetical protein
MGFDMSMDYVYVPYLRLQTRRAHGTEVVGGRRETGRLHVPSKYSKGLTRNDLQNSSSGVHRAQRECRNTYRGIYFHLMRTG